MKSNHTKGEWKVIGNGWVSAYGKLVAKPTSTNMSVEELEANAKLIAAAPELLEALKKSLKIVESITCMSSDEIQIMKDAQQAIKNATK